MKKFIYLLIFLFISSFAYADWFVDAGTGNNADAGTSTDDAFETLEYALKYGNLGSSGGKVWVRRADTGPTPLVEVPTSDIAPAYDGAFDNYLKIIGCPRASVSITSATWTNESTTVDLIVGITLTSTNALTRNIIGPDGKSYFITKVTDSNTLTIDRPYAGADASSTAGACTIEEDEDYDTFAAINDSGWTIKIADWIADADDMPTIDFNAGAYQIALSGDNYHEFKNLKFMNSTDTAGIVNSSSAQGTSFVNCWAYNVNNAPVINLAASEYAFFRNVVIQGGNAGTSNSGILYASGLYKNVAIYACQYGLRYPFKVSGTNINIGVEVANSSYDIQNAALAGNLRDVKLGGTNGLCSIFFGYQHKISIENYGKVLGAHRTFHNTAWFSDSQAFDGSGSVPSQRSGGAAIGIMITPQTTPPPAIDKGYVIFEHVFKLGTAKTIRYYVQSVGALTNTEIRLQGEYVDSYVDSNEYTQTTINSDEAITARDNQADWDQYVEVAVSPATSSLVRVRLIAAYYHATNTFFIDPNAYIY